MWTKARQTLLEHVVGFTSGNTSNQSVRDWLRTREDVVYFFRVESINPEIVGRENEPNWIQLFRG